MLGTQTKARAVGGKEWGSAFAKRSKVASEVLRSQDRLWGLSGRLYTVRLSTEFTKGWYMAE